MSLRRLGLGSRTSRLMWFVALTTTLSVGALVSCAAQAKTVSRGVSFTVQNANRSKLSCPADGASYQVKGHLVGPKSAFASVSKQRRGRSTTLYLHGLGFGEWFWNFPAVPSYNYVGQQAKTGHTSVVIDRLGYGSSSHPNGSQVCLGSQADIAHQVVLQLRSGTYAVDSGKPLRFKRVALAGHSIGSEIAMIEAYSFGDVDDLVLTSFSFSNLPPAQQALGPERLACLAGGQPAGPGLASGYAFFGGPTAADFKSLMFFSAPQPLLAAALPLRNPDPCGDEQSIIPALLQEKANVKRIKVPVLFVCGSKDVLYAPIGCTLESQRFTRSASTTVAIVRGAGHGLTLERQAATFRHDVGSWLAKRGF